MRVLLYDCEIKNPIADKKLVRPEPNITYAQGWTDFVGMGLALIGVHDYHSGFTRLFAEDTLDEFAELVSNADLLVSFNGERFDNPLLAAHGIMIDPTRHYDLFLEIKEAAEAGKYARGYNLDNCVNVNLGVQKSGDGAQFPILWQQGKIGKCVDYALRDIILSQRLLDLVWSQPILDPGNPTRRIFVRNPMD